MADPTPAPPGPAESPLPTGPARIPLVDALRGLAVVAMAVYHLSWDLAYHHLVAWDVVRDPLWRGFAVSIAASFLALSGVSLALAEARGLVPGRAYVLRILKIAAAAAAVSLGTFFIFPDAWIRFGILHMIALGSLLALPFLKAPAIVAAGAAVAVVLAAPALTGPAFDHPALVWTGLSDIVPAMTDYVPVFPWFAAILAGIAVGKGLAAGWIPTGSGDLGRAGRLLGILGRWSLPIYLLHQPILFGLTAAITLTLPVNETVERETFVRACRLECTRTADAGSCARFCDCVAGSLDGTSFWSVRGGDPEMESLIATAAGACRAGDYDPGQP